MSKLGFAVITMGALTALYTVDCKATTPTFQTGTTCADIAGSVSTDCSTAGGSDAACTAAGKAITDQNKLHCVDQ